MSKEELIKEFREKFGHSVYCKEQQEINKTIDRDGRKVCVCGINRIEDFWLSKLEHQRSDLLKKIEGMKAKRYKKGDFLEHRDEYNSGYNQALEDIKKLL